jgi:hypothetical protein
MATLSYNEFRKLHKGIPQGQVSDLWAKYKEGTYSPDADNDGVHDGEELVETSNELSMEEEFAAKNKIAEMVEEENPDLLKDEPPKLTPEEALAQNLQKFGQCYRILQKKNITPADRGQYSSMLIKLAAATRPLDYSCKPEDGWQLWVGPHPDAVLVNERNQTAFCITRQWWAKNYQGSFLVQDMVLDDANRIAVLRNQYRSKNRLVLRNPIPGVEIMLPLSKLEAIVTSSGSYEG